MGNEQVRDALACALYMRYGRQHTTLEWDALLSQDKTYWRREAAAIREAVHNTDHALEVQHLRNIGGRKGATDARGN